MINFKGAILLIHTRMYEHDYQCYMILFFIVVVDVCMFVLASFSVGLFSTEFSIIQMSF